MNKQKMVQVHLHTDASLLDGCASHDKLIKRAVEFGHPAICCTNHGNPSDLFMFAKEAKKQGIKPILGLEFYINNDLRSRVSRKDRDTVEDRDYHQSIYIKNKEGYLNFNYLTYIAHTEGYYYKPRIDFDILFEKKKGLMATSSCMASKLSNYITNNQQREAEELFRKYAMEFGEDFYGEIQFNEIAGQKQINDFVLHMCRKYDIKTLIGGDVHYLEKTDGALQDALIRSKRDSEVDWVIDARHLYFHDVSDYYELNKKFGFNYDDKILEQCFENSLTFSDKVDFEFETGKYHLPKIDTGDKTSKEYIEQVTWEGIAKNIETERKYYPDKYSDDDIDVISKQIEYELKVIDDLGLNDYLLTVYDLINWCKANNIYVGPGRGSAAGSTVAWALAITSLNPIEHGLIFERFINPQRKVMADIDTDFEKGGRDKILQYLIGKYGQESVCNVPTYSTYGVKSALQAMSRGLNKETGHDTILMKKITKLAEIADDKKVWLKGADKKNEIVDYFKRLRKENDDPEIISWIDNNQDTIEFSQRIYGQMNALGSHAGGIVITPGPIYDYIPVTRGSGNLIAAFREADGSSKDLSELGILKLDVLGVRTLSVIKECVESIKRDKGIDLKEQVNYLDLTDEKVLNFFANESSFGIFQMEHSKKFTQHIHVDCFQDIVDINCINRPGPDKYQVKYGQWKDIDKGRVQVSKKELEEIDKERYPLPFMKKILSKTYGALLYQEQLMALVSEAAGFDMGEADAFRRVIGWTKEHPKYYTVEKYFTQLEEEMGKKGYSKADVELFLDICRDFAGYSFNKSHAVVYSYITWQTLYFKCYYPVYFYTAWLNIQTQVEKIPPIISDAKMSGIKILGHSITKSVYHNSVESDDTIRLGYKALRGIGEAVQEEFEELKLTECTELSEILQKPFKKLNSTKLQDLIDVGAFDEFGFDRDKITFIKDLYADKSIEKWFTRQKQTLRLEVIPKILKANFPEMECLKIAMRVKDQPNPGVALIDELIKKIKVGKFDEKKYMKVTMNKQNELMGFNLYSGNKLRDLMRTFEVKGTLPLSKFEDPKKKYFFMVEKIINSKTKTGKPFLNLILNDGTESIKAKCWREVDLVENEVYYAKFRKDDYGYTIDDYSILPT